MVRNNVWEPPQAIAEIVNEVDIIDGVACGLAASTVRPNWYSILRPQE